MNLPSHASAGPRGTTVLGVLGGIASGKSAVARLLAGAEGVVLAADPIAHEVLNSPEVAAEISRAFGPDHLDADGVPDRKKLAALVFRDPAAREKLEGWTHPRVRDRIWARMNEARAAGVPRVVLDVPLLLENDGQHGLARACDVLVFVDTDLAERERRAQASRGWDPGEVARREASQLPLDEKRRAADHVIANRGTPEALEAAVHDLLQRLTRTNLQREARLPLDPPGSNSID